MTNQQITSTVLAKQYPTPLNIYLLIKKTEFYSMDREGRKDAIWV